MKDPYAFRTSCSQNGMRLFIQERPSPVQTFAILFRAGSRYDIIPGTAHFLEHVLPEETTRFPSFEALEEYADDLSLDIDWGSTSTEIMYWTLRALPSRIKEGLSLLNEIIFSSLLSSKSIEHEREVIIREIRRKHSPELWQLFHEGVRRLFPNNRHLAERLSPLGTKETVS